MSSYCKILPQPQLLATTTPIVSSFQHPGKIFHQQKDYNLLKAQMMISMYLAIKHFLIEICTFFRHNASIYLIDYNTV